MLDLANNTVQGPARALLADLAGPDQRNLANAIFCAWIAIGNILGFLSGSYGNWHRWFPFLRNRACCEACGNLKAAFLVAVIFLSLCTSVTLYFAKEVPLAPKQHHRSLLGSSPLLDEVGELKGKTGLERDTPTEHATTNVMDAEHGVETFNESPGPVLVNLLTSLRHLPNGMHSVLIVMALTWFSWFPFFLFDTDWMGREVAEIHSYDQGVREGAFGLLLNSVVLGISSFLIKPMCQRMGSRLVWAFGNFMVFACMAGTAIITLISVKQSTEQNMVAGENEAIKNASLVIFAILGVPLAITSSVPFSITAELTADIGGGQGLAIGVLNLAVVVPQIVVSLGAGPWDALFGGGNAPAFVLASLSALAAAVFAALKLPTLSGTSYKPRGFHHG